MSGLLTRRRAMMQTSASAPAQLWLRGTGDPTLSSINLPFMVNKSNLYQIEVDFYMTESSEGGSYHHFMHNGDAWAAGGLIANKTWNGFMSGNYNVYIKPPYVNVTIDMTTGKRTCTNTKGVSASVTRAFTSYTSTGMVRVFLNKTSAVKEIRVWNSSKSTLLYDFVPAYDNNNIPCLHDTVNDLYYYNDTNALEIVSDPTLP